MYQLLSTKKYLKFIIKNRIAIFLITLSLFVIGIMNINMQLLAKTENQFWTQSLSKTNLDDHKYISKITLEFDNIDAKNIAKAKKFENYLLSIPGVKTDSIFNQSLWYKNDSGDGSESVDVLDSSKMSFLKLDNFIDTFKHQVAPYVDGKHIYFFVSSEQKLSLDNLSNKDHLKLSIDNMSDKETVISSYGVFSFAIFILLFVFLLFIGFFKHFIAGFSSVLMIVITSVFSIAVIQMLMPEYLLHITNILILMSISILDYLYFYYRWHNTQYNKSSIEALEQSLNRNISPAFMTTFITVISLISLYFTGSDIIKAITLSIILPSTIAYMLNITFLPALLSYFKVNNTNILLGKTYGKVSERMLSYNRKLVKILMVASVAFICFMAFEYTSKKDYLFSDNDNSVLQYSIQSNEFSNQHILESFTLEEELKRKFKDIEKISSIGQTLNDIVKLNDYESLDENNIDEAIFFLKLYNDGQFLDKKIDTKVIIQEESLSKPDIIFFIKSKNIDGVKFLDMDSKIANSKFHQIQYLIYSLLIALVSLSVIISIFFKKRIMIIGSLFVNVLPLLAFAILLHIYQVTITIEVFVAMAITLAISSDSTIHFMYAYLRNRYYEQNKERSLKGMMLFSGTPLLISTITLLVTFSLLILTGIPELVKIGTYTAFLMSIGLIVNMLILPVIILSSDKEDVPS